RRNSRRFPAGGLSTGPRERTARSSGGSDLVQSIDPDREADRRDRRYRAKPAQQIVVAPARDEMPIEALRAVMQLEHEPRVAVETTPERGRELDTRDVDALRGKKAGAALEQIERGGEIELVFLGERAQRVGGFIRIAVDAEELLDQRARRARQPGARAER